MTVIIPKLRLAYLAVPKAACTTLKTALFQIDRGIAFSDLSDQDRPFSIHNVYPTRLFSEINKNTLLDYHRLSVVRDPIERFLSAYRNRVMEKDEIAKSKVAKQIESMSLPLRPSLSTFISHLGDYRKVRGIDHHVRPMVDFLGNDPLWFTKIYDIKDTSSMLDHIYEITGVLPPVSVHNSSGHHKIGADTLSASERRVIEDLYAEDYDVFGRILVRSGV